LRIRNSSTDLGIVVKQAAKLGQKQCKIVTLDWLEDSLFRDKKLPVKDYQLSAVLKNERAKELQEAKVAKGHELAGRFVNTSELSPRPFELRLGRL
jgi:hypothetical protein